MEVLGSRCRKSHINFLLWRRLLQVKPHDCQCSLLSFMGYDELLWGGERRRSVTFQRSEVRAPLFPIQPMLWVLFQKVLSLANGPWSQKHRDRRSRSRQPRGRVQKKKGRARKWENMKPTPPPPAGVCMGGGEATRTEHSGHVGAEHTG